MSLYELVLQQDVAQNARILRRCDVEARKKIRGKGKEHRWSKIRQEFYNNLRQEADDVPSDICRICHDADSREHLLAPCRCKGTMALVHISCLVRWLVEANSSSCEVCGHQYTVIRTPRYGMLESMYLWLRYHSPPELLYDIIAFFAFTPIAVLGTYIGVLAAEFFDKIENSDRNDLKVAAIGIVGLVGILCCSYFSWAMARTQEYVMMWRAWRTRHSTVTIRLPPDVQEPSTSQECVLAAEFFDKIENSDRNDLTLAAIGIVGLVCASCCYYFTWVMTRTQEYVMMWHAWWTRHSTVTIRLPPDLQEPSTSQECD